MSKRKRGPNLDEHDIESTQRWAPFPGYTTTKLNDISAQEKAERRRERRREAAAKYRQYVASASYSRAHERSRKPGVRERERLRMAEQRYAICMPNSTLSLTDVSAAVKLRRRQWDPPKKLKTPVEYQPPPDPVPLIDACTPNVESDTDLVNSEHKDILAGDTHSGCTELSNVNADTDFGDSLADSERFAAAVLMEMAQARAASAPLETIPMRLVLLCEVP